MVKKNRKTLSYFFCLTALLIYMFPSGAYAQYVRLRAGGTGKVLEVLDGDSIKVQMTGSGDIALVRLIGIDTSGGDEAFNYLNTTLTGAQVALVQDSSMPSQDGRWNLMYVYYGTRFINNELLEKGCAKLNTAHSNASLYATLQAGERHADTQSLGMWDTGDIYTNYYYHTGGGYYYYTGNGININTATASVMREWLVDVDDGVINNIMNYRAYNPFNNVSEIKFVPGFTKDMYDKNRSQLTVCTNINRATEKELLTLGSISQYEAERIISRREKNSFTDITTLYTEYIISQGRYDQIKPFISIEDKETVNFSIPNMAVNINIASYSQLVSAGLSSSQADALISARGKYSYKSLGELQYVPGVSLSSYDINRLTDNLTVMTDINTATLDELRSIFGDDGNSSDIYNNKPFTAVSGIKSYISDSLYETIAPFIYIGSYTADYININTATVSQMTDIGLSDSQASSLYSARGRMYRSSDIPVDISAFNSRVTLITNINTAGIGELMSLSGDMTRSIASAVVGYRNDQPFGDIEEFRDFLESKDAGSLYNAIRWYITVN